MEYFMLDKITRELTLEKKLDREKIAFHNVVVKAQETCSQEPEAVAEFNRDDLTTINITVDVIDINDNPPTFTEQRFTGGVKVTDKYQKRVVRVLASDPDEGENAVVYYKLIGDFKVKKDENIEHIETPFYVNNVSGEVILNFYPKSDMKGHFDFDVMAYDKDNLNSSTQVLIYLLREDQQIHLTLKIKVDDLSEEKRMKLKRLLESVISEIVIIDDYRAYTGDDNRYNPQDYTDVLFHVVQKDDNSVMEAEEALKLIDKYWGNILENTVNDFYIVGAQKIKDDDISDSWEKQLKFILFGVSSGLLLALIIMSMAFCLRIASLTRKLRAATATSFGSQDSGLNRIGVNDLPNTNKHAVEGSNPMWNCQTELKNQEDAYSVDGSENSLDLKDYGGYSDFTFVNNLSDPDISIPQNIRVQPPLASDKEMEALGIQNESSPPPLVSQQNTFNTLKNMENQWRRRLTQGAVQPPPPYEPNRRRSTFIPSQPSSEL
ncbi:cadherin-23-like [Limulus polyphemus]|uniref:Cadherin-23-like n=1 Tax=Limulus polyphemus TaxID=6850 RepID=A0ABM1TMB4_LIMPO|nr:cadherin-23-like [Limulus polyphemus]